jgi:electron transfer flavoprotein beta subunit
MRVVVLQELAPEAALQEQAVGVSDERQANAARPPDDWHIFRVDAAAAGALRVALRLKADRPETEVVLMHLGPPDAVHWMREEAARGCDAAIRIWDEELALTGTEGKALVLAAALRSHGADLVLTGTTSAGSAGGQLGVLLARHLGVPCVTEACRLVRPRDEGLDQGSSAPALQVTRDLARGYRERDAVVLPAVVTVVPDDGAEELASLPRLVEAQEREIPVWDLATLGVAADQLREAGRALCPGTLQPPRPPLQPLPAPDASAPAFDRILQIVAGSVRRRAGRVVRGTDDQIAEEIFDCLLREGWLDHLRPPDGA